MNTVNITLYVGNMICGQSQEQIDAVNLPASVDAYCTQVEASLPEYAIEWNVVNAEGGAGGANTDDEKVKAVVADAEERVFSAGAFWVNN